MWIPISLFHDTGVLLTRKYGRIENINKRLDSREFGNVEESKLNFKVENQETRIAIRTIFVLRNFGVCSMSSYSKQDLIHFCIYVHQI